MAISMASLPILFYLSLLFLINGVLVQTEQENGTSPRFDSRNRCQIERLSAQEPTQRMESEAGQTELFDERNQQFECVGVSVQRHIIQALGLLLPSFLNAPRLIYIVKGLGISGTVVPGCPESFQSFQGGEMTRQGQSGRERDQHQRINQFREGDILAVPAGVAHWAYNDGEQPIVAVTVIDVSSSANQLDQNRREFLLAGSTREEDSGENILSGFDTETLSQVMGISRELAEKLRGRNDNRGEIVRVEEFHVVRPRRSESREEYEEEREERRANGVEQSFCSMRIKQNIDDPRRADIYNPNAGWLTSVNSNKLPVLQFLRLSAERAVLFRNAFISPHWNANTHAVVYVTNGSGRIQVVNSRGNKVHDGQIRKGQILVIPQHFGVLTQARNEGFEYVTFYTNDDAMVNPIVGMNSAFKGMPEEVLMNSYRISREEARRLKLNRGEEMYLIAHRSISSFA